MTKPKPKPKSKPKPKPRPKPRAKRTPTPTGETLLWSIIIHGGCGDDAFWDFRAGLVALGRKVYEAALKNPDSLAAVADLENLTLFEGFQYVPGAVLEARGLTRAGGRHSEGKPTGTRFGEGADVHRAAFPKLTAKFW